MEQADAGDGRPSRSRRGRAARAASRRAAEPETNPAPPGQVGGRYRPLSDAQVERVLDTAYRILDEIGMAKVPDVVRERRSGEAPASTGSAGCPTLALSWRT